LGFSQNPVGFGKAQLPYNFGCINRFVKGADGGFADYLIRASIIS
jgi:hypothetical protein